ELEPELRLRIGRDVRAARKEPRKRLLVLGRRDIEPPVVVDQRVPESTREECHGFLDSVRKLPDQPLELAEAALELLDRLAVVPPRRKRGDVVAARDARVEIAIRGIVALARDAAHRLEFRERHPEVLVRSAHRRQFSNRWKSATATTVARPQNIAPLRD